LLRQSAIYRAARKKVMSMESTSFFAPFSKAFELLNRPLSLLCIAIMIAGQMLGNSVISLYSGPYPPGGHRFVPLVYMAVPAIKFAIFCLVLFVLARKFGGPEDSARRPNLVTWAVLLLVYFFLTKGVSVLTGRVVGSGIDHPLRLPAALSTSSFLMRMAYFPVMIFIASAAHRGARYRLGEVLAFLTSRGIRWYVCYALFGIVFAATLLMLPLAMGSVSGVPPSGGLFAIALVGVGGQLVGILFAVAAYRAMGNT
jgi:hypothetical protein